MGKIKMEIEKKVREKFEELINSGNQLKYTNDEYG